MGNNANRIHATMHATTSIHCLEFGCSRYSVTWGKKLLQKKKYICYIHVLHGTFFASSPLYFYILTRLILSRRERIDYVIRPIVQIRTRNVKITVISVTATKFRIIQSFGRPLERDALCIFTFLFARLFPAT